MPFGLFLVPHLNAALPAGPFLCSPLSLHPPISHSIGLHGCLSPVGSVPPARVWCGSGGAFCG
eukprot:4334489-Alexandrium_andersonii.AAC.1